LVICAIGSLGIDGARVASKRQKLNDRPAYPKENETESKLLQHRADKTQEIIHTLYFSLDLQTIS
jgi:hypothetical protein